MKIAIISHLFPTKLNPYQGKFIKDQMELLENSSDVQMSQLFIPTPYSIPGTNRATQNSSDILFPKNKARRISYLSFPKKKFPRVIQNSLHKSLTTNIYIDDFDIYHFHFLYPSGLAIPKFKENGAKTVLTIHGGDYYRTISDPDLIPIVKEVFDAVDSILLVGPQLLEDVINAYPQIESKCFEIGNLVDEQVYTLATEDDKNKAKQRLGWDKNKIHFLCVGNNRPEKGIDLLFEAAKNLTDIRGKISIHVVGNMNDKFSMNELPANTSIDIIQPQKPEKLIDYYQASDVYLMPSRNEGFGLSLIEAASTGLPLVANSTGIAKTFISEHSGYLSDSFLPTDFESSIRKMIQSYNNFDKEVIRKSAIEKFGQEGFRNRIITIYRKTIG